MIIYCLPVHLVDIYEWWLYWAEIANSNNFSKIFVTYILKQWLRKVQTGIGMSLIKI